MEPRSVSIAVDINDRTLPLIAGQVEITGYSANFVTAPLEEIFARAFDSQTYDVTELSFSNYIYLTALGDCPYVGLPIFPSRSFRHSAIYVRTDRGITSPRHLVGRTVGVREYSMTAALVARGLLDDEYGVAAADINWVYGRADASDSQPIARLKPSGVSLSAVADGANLSDLLESGEIDAMVAYKPPPSFLAGRPDIRRLFADYPAIEKDYARRTGHFPIMHLVGIRRDLLSALPDLATQLCHGFERAKRYSQLKLSQSQALSTMLPWAVDAYEATTQLLGADYWSYGLERNRTAIETLCRYSYDQGIAPRQLAPDELFAPVTLDWCPKSTP